MIVAICSVFMIYEWFAVATKKPKVSDLSHRWPWGLFVWGWIVMLVVHFTLEMRKR